MSARVFVMPVMVCTRCGDEHILGTPCHCCAQGRAIRDAVRREKQAERWAEWNAQRSERPA